jgi:hypothetical protein
MKHTTDPSTELVAFKQVEGSPTSHNTIIEYLSMFGGRRCGHQTEGGVNSNRSNQLHNIKTRRKELSVASLEFNVNTISSRN